MPKNFISLAVFLGVFAAVFTALTDLAFATQITPKQVQEKIAKMKFPSNSKEVFNSPDEDPEVYCPQFLKNNYRNVKIDGVLSKRWVVDDGKFVRCLRMYKMQPKMTWTVAHAEWSSEDESKWQEFLVKLGRSQCKSVDTCLGSAKANILFDPNDPVDSEGIHYSDCADYPYYLRAYFAYKNKLPFSYIFDFKPMGFNEDLQAAIDEKKFDVRYSNKGNVPNQRFNIPQGTGIARDFFDSLNSMLEVVSSGTFRMLKSSEEKRIETDFYSPAIKPGSIKTGTVIYKTDGHVSTIYEITASGDILYMDAHPGGFVSHGTLSRFDLERYSPELGGGFKNWRPFKILTPQYKNKLIVGGKFQYTSDENIRDYSLEQYYGNSSRPATQWKKAIFLQNNKQVPYWKFLFSNITKGQFKLNPISEISGGMAKLCVQIKERVQPVQVAISKRVHLKAHPAKLPLNIFGGENDWENYSTPGRDFRTRDLVRKMKLAFTEYTLPNSDIAWTQSRAQLIEQLKELVEKKSQSCAISYTNSRGTEVSLDLAKVLTRLGNLSYDPYSCIERRWGAVSSAELASCTDNSEKAEWHQYQQILRNLKERNPEEIMNYTLRDLKKMSTDASIASSTKYSGESFDLLQALQATAALLQRNQ